MQPTTCMLPLYTRGRRGRNGGSPFPFLHGPCSPAPFACKLKQGCEGWVGKVNHSHVAPSSHANRGGGTLPIPMQRVGVPLSFSTWLSIHSCPPPFMHNQVWEQWHTPPFFASAFLHKGGRGEGQGRKGGWGQVQKRGEQKRGEDRGGSWGTTCLWGGQCGIDGPKCCTHS